MQERVVFEYLEKDRLLILKLEVLSLSVDVSETELAFEQTFKSEAK